MMNVFYSIDSKLQIRYDDDGEGILDNMLAILLVNEVIFTNSFWWKNKENRAQFFKNKDDHNVIDWSKEDAKLISIHVNCNDVFAWGVADAEQLHYDEIEDLFEHFEKDPIDGPTIWCIKKRKMKPQEPVENALRKNIIWDLDEIYKGFDDDSI